ncbi:beta-N-acetylhexosaminidase [Goodfellowiella coeruleoviolacea]|nr:beta-N-acetylhexosaminidase [Goodfellowiella coeruleoviolacea]
MTHQRSRPTRVLAAVLLAAVTGLAPGVVATASAAEPTPTTAAPQENRMRDVVPAPVAATPDPKATFRLTRSTRIHTQAGAPAAAEVGAYLAGLLRPATGFDLPVTPVHGRPTGGINLLLTGADARVGQEGYQLDVTDRAVVIRANTRAGLVNGVQTLRQLLPAQVGSATPQRVDWTVPGGHVVDWPRFAERGAMLDVARHFFPVADVKRYIDELALYKINTLHLHLADDQGWRIEITSWPRLASYGGSTQVGGGTGGYYTQEQYRDIVAYAQARNITIIPEIDMPGHTNAALASYPELNCDGVAPPLYTGTEVGFSSLCVPLERTYEFVDDVVREVAALTPGRYLHIGGDEAHSTEEADYRAFMARVLPIVTKYGKVPAGWHEFLKATPPTESRPQYWGTATVDQEVAEAVARGTKVVLSPANKTYLDMKYDENTPLGLKWAGYIEVRDAYDWNPGDYLDGVAEEDVLGVEAPLWSETLTTMDEIEFMAFPRLPAIAELGWSAAASHDWTDFARRLAAQAPRWQAMGINYYRSPQVPWPGQG